MIKFSSSLFLFGILIIILTIITIIFHETCVIITEHPPNALSSCERTTGEQAGCTLIRTPYEKCTSIWLKLTTEYGRVTQFR